MNGIHFVWDTALVLDTAASHVSLYTQERTHQLHHPPSPNLFHLLEHQTSVNHSIFFPFPLLPIGNEQPNLVNSASKLSQCYLLSLPSSTFSPTTAFLPLALILTQQELSAESSTIITSLYFQSTWHLDVFPAIPPYNWAPGLHWQNTALGASLPVVPTPSKRPASIQSLPHQTGSGS